MKSIDILCHLFTKDGIEKSYNENEEIRNLVKWWRIEDRIKSYTPEEFIKIMDEAYVEKVLIPADQMRSYKNGNMIWDFSIDSVAEVVKSYPDRFAGLAGINPFKKMDGVREFEKAIREFGFKGAYLHTYGFGLPIDDRLYYPFYAKAVELGVPVMMQVGHSAEQMPSALGRPILLDNIALDFPDLSIVAAHTGWPWVEELIALAWKHKNLYIGIDAHLPRYIDPSLIRFLKTRGSDKVLYGTNYPGVLHKESREQIEEMQLKDDIKVKLLRENAIRVFRL